MATGFANLASADPRLGDEADNIGKQRNGSVAANIHDSTVAQGRRRSVIYNDTSIEFEDYHYWAKLSREYESHIDVSGFGLQNVLKIGTKGDHANAAAPQELPQNTGSDSDHAVDEKNGTVAPAESRYGITESEWSVSEVNSNAHPTHTYMHTGTTLRELCVPQLGDRSST